MALESLQGLVTKEDPYHIHKGLGILALCSFVYRLSLYMDVPLDMAFATQTYLTLPTILLHFALNATSFIFKLPNRRISKGTRIWPEYRFHSLVFTSRSLAIMLLIYIEQTFHLPRLHGLNYVIVIGTMLAADYGSHMAGKYQSNSIRDLDSPVVVRYLFSLMQFLGTAGCLLGQRRFTLQFLYLIVIQGNAFNMTLQRKNILSHWGSVVVYALLFVVVAPTSNGELMIPTVSGARLTWIAGSAAFMIRTTPLPSVFKPLQNKYVVWTMAAYFMHRQRPLAFPDEYFTYEADLTQYELIQMYILSYRVFYAVAAFTCTFGYCQQQSAKKKKKQQQEKVETKPIIKEEDVPEEDEKENVDASKEKDTKKSEDCMVDTQQKK